MIHEIILEFKLSAITGLSTLVNFPQYVPAYYLWTRIDIISGSNVLDVIYPGQQFLSNNFFNTDDDRNC